MSDIRPRIKIPRERLLKIRERMYRETMKKRQKPFIFRFLFDMSLIFIGFGIILAAIFMVWVSTLKLPTFNDFESRKIANSTKIYDRTGKVLLYNIHDNIKRTEVPFDKINQHVKDAVISIEDSQFYSHHGIQPKAIIRSVFKTAIGDKQGGSTITQQVIKNSLLTPEQTITRKMKEWILAIKLEQHLSKNDILNIYLNESPFGGTIYGVEEASQTYFGKPASNLTIAESAYLAAMPQAPSRYSPYGTHRNLLEDRKNVVLSRMKELGYISETEYTSAKNEKVTFLPQETQNGKALHFVFYVKDLLINQFGEDVVENGGLQVTTTLDYELQKRAEAVVKQYATTNKKIYDAENAGLVALDPKTGQVLSMVGSKDYFDTEIDGKYNIALAKRQPGSSFKPIVYAASFLKGYTPETVLLDVPTEFNTGCPAEIAENSPDECYSPVNYDGKYRGPVSLREALAQSLNVPAVKLLYLTGLDNSIELAKSMGITTLADKSRYGLTLVLGGGEVTLLELTGAYSTFANNGDRSQISPILDVKNNVGESLYTYKNQTKNVLPKDVTLKISSVLSDNVARTPAFGATSPLYFPTHQVAVKTGTTNDYRDVWTVGYTPSIVVGVWGGNNDNHPINKKSAGSVISPMWNAFMQEYFAQHQEVETFETPPAIDETINPLLRGIWCSQGSDIHTILYYLNKNNPTEYTPGNTSDPQFKNWEGAINLHKDLLVCPFGQSELSNVSSVAAQNSIDQQNQIEKNALDNTNTNTQTYNPNSPANINFRMSGLRSSYEYGIDSIIEISIISPENILRVEYSIDGTYITTSRISPYIAQITPSEAGVDLGNHTLTARVYTNRGYADKSVTIHIK